MVRMQAMTTRIQFNGESLRPRTIKCPSGNRYAFEPVISRHIEMADEDAAWLLDTYGSAWSRVEAEDSHAASTRKIKATDAKSKADDGKE